MEWEGRKLDDERQEEAKEPPCLHNEREELAALRQFRNIESQLSRAEQSRHLEQIEDGAEHQDATKEGVYQEFHRRISASGTSPDGDQEIHRDQLQLPQNEELKEIQRNEY